jgi:aryl-phospho-beta-D-glucosidase BglC (GH1 family)
LEYSQFFSHYTAGVNLGGWLSQYQNYDHSHFKSFITEQDIQRIASWGMDHIRLPVDYPVLEADSQPFHYLESGLVYLDLCLAWCKKAGLGLIIDLHKAPGYGFDHPSASSLFDDPLKQERFLALWVELARRYKSEGSHLTFELLNEIVLPTSLPWNLLANRAIQAIRGIDQQRIIILEIIQFDCRLIRIGSIQRPAHRLHLSLLRADGRHPSKSPLGAFSPGLRPAS